MFSIPFEAPIEDRKMDWAWCRTSAGSWDSKNGIVWFFGATGVVLRALKWNDTKTREYELIKRSVRKSLRCLNVNQLVPWYSRGPMIEHWAIYVWEKPFIERNRHLRLFKFLQYGDSLPKTSPIATDDVTGPADRRIAAIRCYGASKNFILGESEKLAASDDDLEA